jgi:hypothetical protein
VSRRAAWWSIFALFAIPAAFAFYADEQAACHRENLFNGHFWTRDFSSDIVISGDEQSRRIDFTRLRQFKTICIVSLYGPGRPYESKWMMENMRRDGPKACWPEIDGRLTIAGVFENGVPNWTYLTLSGPNNEYLDESCVATEDAILRCSNNVCKFARSYDMNGPM